LPYGRQDDTTAAALLYVADTLIGDKAGNTAEESAVASGVQVQGE